MRTGAPHSTLSKRYVRALHVVDGAIADPDRSRIDIGEAALEIGAHALAIEFAAFVPGIDGQLNGGMELSQHGARCCRQEGRQGECRAARRRARWPHDRPCSSPCIRDRGTRPGTELWDIAERSGSAVLFAAFACRRARACCTFLRSRQSSGAECSLGHAVVFGCVCRITPKYS